MPVAVTGCGGPASRALRLCRRHYGAPCGELVERWCQRSAASRVARAGAAGWWRRPPPRASPSVNPELLPARSPSASAAAEPSRQLLRCLHFGFALPPPSARAPHRPLPASLSLLFFFVALVSARVADPWPLRRRRCNRCRDAGLSFRFPVWRS